MRQLLNHCMLFPVAIGMIVHSMSVIAQTDRPADRAVDFSKEIQPILARHCWSCHGKEKQESGLRLDSRQAMFLGGDSGKVVVSGKSANSRLIQLITSDDPDKAMPPEGARLNEREVASLRAWIDQGCVWPGSEGIEKSQSTHWAYQPLHDFPLPVIKDVNWPKNAIDFFVAHELAKQSISPSPEANRYTLIRRLSLDLLGLLPSVEEVDEFVTDQRPNAYELLVDRLLDSKHFGERWGRHWLDLARYADSDGYEKDNARPDAYRWRDWVIDAINADMPFDQFTIEQLAGDLLPDASAMQRLATAFHRQTLTNTEGGTDKEQFRVEACFDRTETTGTVWLGLTIGCARCHSHKYDAISQREYYQMFAAFNNGDEETTVVPKSQAEVDAYQPAKAAHDASVAELESQLRSAQLQQEPEFNKWLNEVLAQHQRAALEPVKQYALENVTIAGDGNMSFAIQSDGSILVTGDNPATAQYTITAKVPSADPSALRLDVLPDDSLPKKGPGRAAQGNFVLSELIAEGSAIATFAEPQRIEFVSAKADFEQADRPWQANGVFDGDSGTGWAIAPEAGKPHWLILQFKQPLDSQRSQFLRIRLSHQYGKKHTLGRFKLTLQTGYQPDVPLPDELMKVVTNVLNSQSKTSSPGNQSASTSQEQSLTTKGLAAHDRQKLLDFFSSLQLDTKSLVVRLSELKKKEPPKPELTVRVIAQRTQEPRKTFVLRRGEFLEPITESEIQPAGLSLLPPMVARHQNALADRLDLAHWLVSPANPLTPRGTVNHIWRILFGEGLVRTPNDFGVRGELPSHPELLDWLASDFIGKHSYEIASVPWSRKAIIKRIVMSATYRQDSKHRPELLELDPQNRLLARQNRIRVEGEIVRDICLDAASLLAKQIGGPSVYPPLPAGIAELSYAGNFKWDTSKGADRYRRGMYTFFKRTAPHPNLTTFDCPDANLTCVERQASNTPLQALTVLNNESFLEAARALANRLVATTGDDSYRLTLAFRICVARQPSTAEHRELRQLLADSQNWYRDRPDEAKKLVGENAGSRSAESLAAWTATARILLNLDEFLTRE